MLTDLSLVIPTYNRQSHSIRQMLIWRDSQVKVHVFDGTSTPINSEIIKDNSRNIHYHHMPCSLEERLGKAAEIVDTPYVVLLGDDEFFIPSALENCVQQLAAYPDLVACIGRTMGFYRSNGKIYAAPAYLEMKNYKIEDQTPKERMMAHMAHYTPSTFYAVQRVDVWKNNMSLLASGRGKYSCPYVGEMQIELGTCYQGKSIVIDNLMWMRNKENAPIDDAKFNRKLSFSSWYNDPRHHEEVEQFGDLTAIAFSRIDGGDKATIVSDVRNAVELYLQGLKAPSFIRRMLSRYMPQKLKRLIKGWKLLPDAARLMQYNGVTVDFEQLKVFTSFFCRNGTEI
jgi:glycosyltransferase domain-containing protein